MIDFVTHTAGPADDVLVLELSGRLDEHASQFLFDCLVGHIERGRNKLVLDCGNLDHITSFGLGTLVRIHSRLKPSGGVVHLAAVGGVVAKVIHVVHFDRLFNMYETVEEAVAAFD